MATVERHEFVAAFEPLVLALRADFDKPSWTVYFRVMQKVPASLLEAAVEQYFADGITFLPTAPELLAACETARRRMLALHPYDGCAECEDQRGYRTVIGESGQKTVERCPCKARHLDKLARMGLGEPLAALIGEVSRESEQVYPTREQLPAPIRERLTEIAGQRLLR